MSQIVHSSVDSIDTPKKRSLWPAVMLVISITCGPAVVAFVFTMLK